MVGPLRRTLAVAAVAATAALATASPADAQASSYEELQRFSAVLNHIRMNYADSVGYGGLVHAAIDGMLRSLDPHSWYASREDYERLSALERGELAETGIRLELVEEVPTVVTITRNSAAEKAGVRPSDRVIMIDARPVVGMSAQALALALAGEKGSKVGVLLERGSRLEPDTVSIQLKRDFPKGGSSVHDARMLDGRTGYVRLDEFGVDASADVRAAIRRLRGQKADRVVLDLRGNPGGSVTEAVDMAAEFLPARTLVFSTRGRKRAVNEEFRTKGAGDFVALPLVVLIDEGSASASEALAGSLQDHDRARIVGRRSFGKALMQTGFIVPAGFVMLTVGHVVTPSGRIVQRRYRGQAVQQYYAAAGAAGAAEDTLPEYRTDAGRVVRGGGGIRPDVELPAPPSLPRWWTVAADSGYDAAVADSVAHTLGTDAAAREGWMGSPARWEAALLAPFLERVRARLGVTARPEPAVAADISRRLAARVAFVRWPPDGGRELWVRSDPDVAAAIAAFDAPAP
jgi:carboxyl-terminal processing protease